MRDVHNNIKPIQSIKPSSFTATQNGDPVDRQGFSTASVLFYLWIGDYTDSNEVYTPKLQDSDDASTWTDVPAEKIEGSLNAVTTLGEEGIQSVGYKGSRRYLRAVVTIAGTSPSIIATATVMLGKPHQAPVA